MHRRVFRIHEGVEEQVGAGVPMWLSKCGKQGAGRLTKPGGRATRPDAVSAGDQRLGLPVA